MNMGLIKMGYPPENGNNMHKIFLAEEILVY